MKIILLFALIMTEPLFCASAELQKPNIIVLMTDQERHPAEGWAKAHLPSHERLKNHGLAYERAYTSACMCSPSRAALLTSQYSTINHVALTLADAKASPTLPAKDVLTNLASLIQEKSDYEVVWKGKWHLSYAADGLEK